MNKTIFEYSDYKGYLREFIQHQPGKGYGYRSRIAEVVRCNVAYVSQVLNQGAHFSLEQAEELNDLLGHSPSEREYFLLLVQVARAGTPKLKKQLHSQLTLLVEKNQVLKDRVDIKKTLSQLDQVRYYSSWQYAAVHILVSIPEFQTKEAISQRLGLSIDKVNQALEFLLSIGLIEQKGGRFLVGVTRVFLGNDSVMLEKHHANWRMKALESLGNPHERDLHFSNVVSLSRNDVLKVKERLIQGIEEARAMVRESKPDEEMYCLCLDFFRV